jgi:hypothetical protein
MSKQRAVPSRVLLACLLLGSGGCSLFVSLNDVVPDEPDTASGVGGAGGTIGAGAGGAGGSMVSDASVGGAAGAGGMTMGRPDASGMTPLDSGADAAACNNPMYPTYCPARGSAADGGVPAGCWTQTTDCSTIKNCGGTPHACPTGYAFDCPSNQCVLSCNPTCVCTNPTYPMACPTVGSLTDGGVPADCWSAGTDCSTVKNCGNGMYHACRTGFIYDCAAAQCIAADGGRDAGTDARADATVTCTGGLTPCGNRCVDLRSDETACGNCSTVCPNNNTCLAGQCCATPAAGGTCNLPSCGCATGRVCYPDTVQTGLSCFVTDGVQEGQACPNGEVCASGSGCFGSMCKRYCNADTDCTAFDGARLCLQTIWPDQTDISGVLVCQRICDPVSPQSPRSPLQTCPAGFNCLAGDTMPGASDCVPGGTGGLGAACTTRAECLPGYYCTVNGICNRYCYTTADCTGGSTCQFFATPEYAGTRQVGFCSLQ